MLVVFLGYFTFVDVMTQRHITETQSRLDVTCWLSAVVVVDDDGSGIVLCLVEPPVCLHCCLWESLGSTNDVHIFCPAREIIMPTLTEGKISTRRGGRYMTQSVADLGGASISCSFWENLAKSYVGGLAFPLRGNPASITANVLSNAQFILLDENKIEFIFC